MTPVRFVLICQNNGACVLFAMFGAGCASYPADPTAWNALESDDMVTVEQLCGTPTKQVKEAQKPQPEIQHWYYGTGGLPSKVLIFKGGILQ